MKAYRNAGWILLAIALLHNAVGLLLGWDVLTQVAGEGFWNTIEPNGQVYFDRSAIVWFLISGTFWGLMGVLIQTQLNQGLELPSWLGMSFILIGLLVAILMPLSGAWLFLPYGALICFGNRLVRE